MKKKIVEALAVLILLGGMVQIAEPLPKRAEKDIDLSLLEPREPKTEPSLEANDVNTVSVSECEEWDEDFCDSLEILATCVEAEAGNQDIMGKRLVADVILNRVDSPRFPDDIEGVITQKYHFSTYWDGTMARIEPSPETFEAVQMELYGQRLDENILFFTAGDYNTYCTPAYTYGAHYFGY